MIFLLDDNNDAYKMADGKKMHNANFSGCMHQQQSITNIKYGYEE